ncbi:MAG: EamA family transporter [Pyrinomonadaceae bacterium]
MRDVLLTALAPIIWGTTYFVTTQFLPPNRPLFVSTIRATPIGLLMLAGLRELPKGISLLRTSVLGTLNIGLFFALLFTAAYRLPGGVVATLMAIQPLLVALLAWVILAEHPALRTFLAAAFGLLGVTLIVLGPTAPLDTVGVIAGLAATLVMASGTVLTKRWGRSAPLVVFTSWQLVAGGLILLPFALVVEGSPPTLTTRNLFGFAWLGMVGTGIAYTLWFRGLGKLKASTVALLGLLSPVSAVLLDLLLLQKSFSRVQVGGAALVLGSIVISQLRSEERKTATT